MNKFAFFSLLFRQNIIQIQQFKLITDGRLENLFETPSENYYYASIFE